MSKAAEGETINMDFLTMDLEYGWFCAMTLRIQLARKYMLVKHNMFNDWSQDFKVQSWLRRSNLNEINLVQLREGYIWNNIELVNSGS